MSFNQARYQKSEAAQDRRTGRSASFNQQRSSSGGYSKGGGAPAPSPSLSTNRSYKKSNNAQGGQSRVNVRPPNIPSEPAVGAPPTQHNLQNGAHVQPQPQPQPQPQGQSDAGHTSATAKPAETPPASNRSTRALPKAPTSQPSAVSSSEMLPPSTPQKAPGDASKGFSFQFGSLSPGLMNGMQIPARTSSAPPNLDEQKRDQARHDAIKTGPPVPVPPAPKHPLPKRDMSASDHSIAGDSHTVSKGKKDQVPPIPPSVQSQKPSAHAISGIPIQMPFNQPQVPIQFSGPNTSIQSQGMASASLQMPIPVPMLPVGSAPPMQQQMFVAGLQPHMMQPQGIMHQGQGLNFGAQMNSQFSPPLGTLGMSIGPYSQQQGAKFGGGLRKTPVKITHPETHQEVRLDKRTEGFSDGVPSSRSHPNVSPQAQHISSYPPNHPVNYYTNSFGGPVYYAGPSTHPLSGTQMTPASQASRFNPSVNQGAQRMTLTNSQDNSQLPERTGISIRAAVEPPKQDQMQNSLAPPSALAQGTSKPKIGSDGENITGLSSANLLPAFDKVESPNAVNVSANSASRNSEVPRGPLSKEPGSQLGALPGPNKQYVGSTGASGEHSVTSSSTGNRSSTEAALTNVAGSQLGALPGPNKQHVGSTGFSGEQSVTSSSTANHSSTEAALTNVAGRRMENLSRSNSIKNHEQGKKGDDPHPIKVDEEGNSISAVALRESSLSGVLENLEAKTTDTCPSGICEDVPESVSELLSTTDALSPDILELKCNGVGEGIVSVSSEISAGVPVLDNSQSSQQSIQDDSAEKNEILDNTDADRGELESTGPVVEQPKESDSSVVSSVSVSLEHSDIIRGGDQDSAPLVEASGKEVPTSTTERTGLDEERYDRGIDKANLEMPTSSSVDFKTGEATPCDAVPLASVHGDNSYADASLNGRDEVIDSSSVSMSESLKAGAEDDGDVTESLEDSLKSVQTAVPKDKPAPEISRASSNLARGKKKRKEFLLKADAAGPTLDLYMAYKGSEERKEAFKSSKGTEIPSEDIHDNQAAAETSPKEAVVSDDVEQIKAEIDDWEDAADVSSPALEPSTSGQQVDVFVPSKENRNGFVGRKYSRDFLLKFAERCTNLPENFEVTHDIAEAFNPSVNVSRFADRDSHPSPGRTIDRQSGGARLERRGSGLVDDDRWNKLPGAGPFGGPGRDLRLDVGLGSNLGLRSGQGGNYGVLRNPRAQTPVQYAGGILSGPMQSPGFQGGMQRNNSDADRWQRGTGFHQKGLMPSPQTPLQVMHRAENKYEVGKVQDGEEGKKQRQLKAILNKLTPQNFQKLFEQVKAVNIDNATTLRGLISQIFDKALMEPTFCEMYADLCSHLAQELPDFTEDENRITFKRVLLNKCQEEFERGEREEEEANKAEEEGEIKQSEGEREEKRIKARRRMLGNIRLIGELYKKKMLTEKIMHECIKKLLGVQQETPDEEDLEALCKLMSTIGAMIDHAKAKDHMDAYFDRMGILSNNMNLSSRVRFMLKDLIDLRKNKWQQRRKVEGPKKIDEVHRDAAQERHAQVGRNSRGSGINSSRSRQPVDFSSRGSSMLSSPNAQVSGFRALQSQVRGPGSQDVRFEERQPHEPRPLAVPLSQRLGDDSHSITLGPQGGLGRGMSYRGSSSMSSTSVADISSSLMDSRRIADGSNGFSSVEKTSHGSRETGTSSMADRLSGSGAYDQTGVHRNRPGSREGFDRSGGNSPSLRVQGTSFSQDISSEKVWPDEKLRDMSIAAIKEFYSAKDEKEISLCIKDLNSPSFYPTMISLWVTDSFERKDSERDLLAKLLISLTTRPQECILSEDDLKKGFESVLTTLEDSVNDAPKAAEYVGRIFGKVIAETMISLKEIGQLIQKGGEEPGQLLKVGLAADVLGSTLEVIKSEKGETDFNEIRSQSNLQLEDFRLPGTRSSRILDQFI